MDSANHSALVLFPSVALFAMSGAMEVGSTTVLMDRVSTLAHVLYVVLFHSATIHMRFRATSVVRLILLRIR